MFRKRRRDEDLAGAADAPAVATDPGAADPGDAGPVTPVRAPTDGPFDAADAPDDATPRLDIGGLQVPVPDGVELRLEVDQETNSVVAAVAVIGVNALQLGAFAAPRTAGIWDEVAAEIADGIRSSGGSADLVDGPFGRELHGRLPMEGPHGQRTLEPARFIGVDGPRWFLRGLFQGPAATDPLQARPLEEIFRGVVVVRGNDAMAPRDAIPLRMPREVSEAAEAAEGGGAGEGGPDDGGPEGAASGGGDRFALDPFERGPEITEIR